MTTDNRRKAVIYCRVSSKKQATDGSGLDSQEHRCREYAEARGLSVEAVFPDDISGGGDFMNRPGMVALLAYLDAKSDENYVVIFDDLKRYARDTEFHLKLRREMAARGATRACLNFNFEDSPEGKFLETIIAAQGELEREQNQRQVVQKMKARVEQGYWVFRAPVGYRYEKVKGRGQMLVRDEPAASVVAEALESFASGRLQSQSEIRRFLQDTPGYPKCSSGYVHPSRIQEILDRPIYAGYVCHEPWGIGMTKGHHDPLVSLSTWNRIQRLKDEARNAPARKDLHDDFPLRGFVSCDDCGRPMTACWSTGRHKKYPYYLCNTRGCDSHRKSIRREKIESDFEALLGSMTPTMELCRMIFEMMREQWGVRRQSAKEHESHLKRDLISIERKMSGLVDRILDAGPSCLAATYESRLKELEMQKAELQEKLSESPRIRGDLEGVFRTALQFLSNPLNLWQSERLEDKRAVLKMVFADRLSYHRENGFRTANTTLPFKALAHFSDNNLGMVEPGGIEPPTSCMPCKRSPN